MRLLIFFILLFSFKTYAQSPMVFEYGIGGLTPHIKAPPTNDNLCNEVVSGSGIIFNRTHTYRVSGEHFTTGAIVGENSYCQPIWGALTSYHLYQSQNVQVKGTVGFYHFDTKGFDFSEGAYFARVGNFYFVPVGGVEVAVNLYQSKNYKVQMLNLLTPVIFNHSIALTFDI